MKTSIKLSVIALGLVVAIPGHAELRLGNWDLAGSVGLGFQMTNGAEEKSARFVKFRDLRDSVLANASLDAGAGSYFMSFDASRIGLDDQRYTLMGGRYESFKYNLFYDSIIHNMSFNARTFHTGVGTNELNYPDTVVPGTFSTWPDALFDYRVKQKKYGFEGTFFSDSPIFFSLGFDQTLSDGVKVVGADDNNTSGGQRKGLEMPEPVDYKNNTAYAKAGFKADDFKASVDGSFSRFTNASHYLAFRNPYHASTGMADLLSLSPSNDYWKVGTKATWWRLPLDSTFALRASYSKLTNSVDFPTQIATTANNTGTQVDVIATDMTFDGDVSYGTVGATLASDPVENLSSKIYYNFLRKWNKSDEITFTNDIGGAGLGRVTNHIFSYYKHNAGVDLGYKLPAKTKASAGYDHQNLHRTRHDAEKTVDNTVYGQLKNSYFDFLSAHVKYQLMDRDSEMGFVLDELVGVQQNLFYVRPFDAATKKQYALKTGLDINLFANLDLSFEYAHKRNNYKESILGRTSDKVDGLFGSITYAMPKVFRVSAFGDYEQTKFTAKHYRHTSGAPDPENPVATGANNYNWTDNGTDKAWGWGFNLGVPVIENTLDFSAGWQQYRASGVVTFDIQRLASGDLPGTTGTVRDIDLFDNYLRNTVNAKTTYKFSEALSASLGYMYELHKYEDVSFANYVNVPGAAAAYLTGAYADHSYKAHTGYLVAEYRF